MKRLFLAISIIICLPFLVNGRELPRHVQKSLDSLLHTGLARGYYPGVSVIIGCRGDVLYEQHLGYRDAEKTEEVIAEDVYDLASLTKVVSTTFAVMKLYDEKRIDLNKTVGDYIDYYSASEVEKIPISQLLTHTSGLPPFAIYPLVFRNSEGGALIRAKYDAESYPLNVDKNCYLCATPEADPEYISRTERYGWRRAGDSTWVNPEIDRLISDKIMDSYNEELRGKYRYSDTNFHILREIVERVTGEGLDSYTRSLFDRLDMVNTGYRPSEWIRFENIIPTEYDHLMQRGAIRGYPHDEWAAVSEHAVNGHAGLFATSADLVKFSNMMLGEGNYNGDRILSRETVRLFTSSPLTPKKIYRGLGWDKRSPESPLGGGYGHTGYTGTMIWIDPSLDIYMVFLSNRVHPTRLNTGLSDSSLRTRMWEILKKSKQRKEF